MSLLTQRQRVASFTSFSGQRLGSPLGGRSGISGISTVPTLPSATINNNAELIAFQQRYGYTNAELYGILQSYGISNDQLFAMMGAGILTVGYLLNLFGDDILVGANAAWVASDRTSDYGLQELTGKGAANAILGNTEGANVNAPVLAKWGGSDWFYFPGTSGNTITITNPDDPAAKTHTLYYQDGTTDTVSPSGATLTFGGTDSKYTAKKVVRILSADGKIDLRASAASQTAVPNAGTSGGSATINRTSTGLKTEIVTCDRLLFNPSGPHYLETADHPLLNFTSAQSFTAIWHGLKHNPNTSLGTLMAKKGGFGTATDGWLLGLFTTAPDVRFQLADGGAVTGPVDQSTVIYDSTPSIVAGIADAGNAVSLSNKGQVTTVGPHSFDLGNANTLTVGTTGGKTSAASFSYFGHAIFPWALSAAELVAVKAAFDSRLGGSRVI